jgi:dienelactone hydrolase
MKRLLASAAALAATSLLAAAAASAAHPAGPVALTGTLSGANYSIGVPAAWNGGLIVLAHGYRDLADEPGQVDDTAAMDGDFAALAAALESEGYAVAATSYERNGWAVKPALNDLTDLTGYFRGHVGMPNRTLLVGFSLGSLPTLQLAERNGGLFDGFLPACAVAAGSDRAWDGAADNLLAYQTAFGGMPASWGTVADGADYVDAASQVWPLVIGQLTTDPLGPSKFEFMRLVSGVPQSAGYYPVGLLTNMFFFTEARGELEREAGGPIVQNANHTYMLTPGDQVYLNAIGISYATQTAWLAQMNSTHFSAPPSSRNYVAHYASFSGKIKHPVLTMHTETDTLVPVNHEAAYKATVDAAGRGNLLYQAFTTGDGHCAFTPQQTLTSIGVLDQWVQTGVRPTAAAFPSTLGFDQAFTPPAWPQP